MNRTTIGLWFVSGWFAVGCGGARPDHLGSVDGRLVPCPDSPNCVSSFAFDEGHAVDPLPASPEDPIGTWAVNIKAMGGEVTSQNANYLHAEFTSRIFRFVDDLEILWDGQSDIVHVRSASRLGWSDMGVNRRRVRELQARAR